MAERLVFGEDTLAVVELRVDPAQPEKSFVAALEKRRVMILRMPGGSVCALTHGLKALDLEFEDFPQMSQQSKNLSGFVSHTPGGGAITPGHEP